MKNKYFNILQVILLAILFFSCTPKRKIAEVYYYLNMQDTTCIPVLNYYLINDSLYSLYYVYARRDAIFDFSISSGLYLKIGSKYIFTDILSGSSVIVEKNKKTLKPITGRFKNFLFNNSNDEDFTDTVIVERMYKELSENYKIAQSIKNNLRKIMKNDSALKSFRLDKTFNFKNDLELLTINTNGTYALKFDKFVFSSGVFTCVSGHLQFTDKLAGAVYDAVILKDSSLYTGSLPFSTVYNKLKLEPVFNSKK